MGDLDGQDERRGKGGGRAYEERERGRGGVRTATVTRSSCERCRMKRVCLKIENPMSRAVWCRRRLVFVWRCHGLDSSVCAVSSSKLLMCIRHGVLEAGLGASKSVLYLAGPFALGTPVAPCTRQPRGTAPAARPGRDGTRSGPSRPPAHNAEYGRGAGSRCSKVTKEPFWSQSTT